MSYLLKKMSIPGFKLPILFYAMLAFCLIYNFFIPLHPDEAYYWTWSRHLDWNYYDGPPMIAFMIRIATTLFGTSAWSIKLVGVTCAFGTAILAYRWTEQLFTQATADKLLVLLLLFPFFQASTVIATYDAPLVFFWMATLYSTWLALKNQRALPWLLAGISAAALILSKTPGVLLLVVLAGYILFSKHRRCLLTPYPYIAIICVLIALTPIIIWNAHHQWVSLNFQLQRGMAGEKVFSWNYCVNFLSGQFLACNPLFFILLLTACIRYGNRLASESFAYLLLAFFLPWLFFAYQACFHESEVNWPAATYLSALIFIAAYIEAYRATILYKIYIGFSLLFIIIAKLPFLIGIFPQQGFLLAKFVGYQPLISQAVPYFDAQTPIVSDTYQTASETTFYAPGHPTVYLLAPLRATQYDLWDNGMRTSVHQGKIPRVIYIGDAENLSMLGAYFSHCTISATLNYQSKIVDRQLILAACTQPIITSVASK